MVEQGRSDEVALRDVLITEGLLVAGALAAVDDQLGTLLDALGDVAADTLEGGRGDQGGP